MFWYDNQGVMRDYYGRPIPQPAVPPQMHFPNFGNHEESDMKKMSSNISDYLGGKKPPKTLEFILIDNDDEVKDLNNREAREGDKFHYYNPKSGKIYKKYYDFDPEVDKMVILEASFFSKNEEKISPTSHVEFSGESKKSDDRYDDLLNEIMNIRLELELLKEEKANERGYTDENGKINES